MLQRKLAKSALTGDSEPWTDYLETTASKPYYRFSFNDELAKKAGKRIFETNEFGVNYEYQIVERLSGNAIDRYTAEKGGLAVKNGSSGDYEITNTLKPEKVRVDVSKTWNLGGVTKDDIYTGFTASLERKTAKPESSYTAVEGVASQPVPRTGVISFTDLDKYDADGYEYTYRVVETDGNKTYYWSGDSITTAEGRDATDGVTDGVINLSLVNDHKAMNTEAVITGTKRITDTSGGATKSLAGFRFGLYEDAEATKALKIKGSNAVAISDADGSFSFASISYNEIEVGTHTYYLKEIKGEDARTGYAYDETVYPVTVTVAYNSDKSDISAAVSYGSSNVPYVITNPYSTKGSFTLTVTKAMTDDYWPAGVEYGFRVTDNGVEVAGSPVTLNNANRSKDFTFDKYTAQGVHKYVVTELDKDGNAVTKSTVKDGITYDDPKEVTVKFTDNGRGGLDATIGEDKAVITGWTAEFENSYSASANFIPSVRKRMIGSTITEPISFTLTGTDEEGNVIEETETVELPASEVNEGTVKFSEKTYDNSDIGKTYTYTINEVMPKDAVPDENGKYVYHGVVYDEKSHAVTVRIADGGNGDLVKTIAVDGASSSDGEVLITNTYITNGSVTLALQKDVQTPNGAHTFPREGMAGKFSFVLKDKATGQTLGAEKTTNDTGYVEFDPIPYTNDDLVNPVHEYVIEETKYDGYKPVTLSQDVTVTLEDNQGVIRAKSIVYANGDQTTLTLLIPTKPQARLRLM